MARASSRARIALLAILSLTAVALIVVAAVYAASSDDEGTPSPVHLGPSYTEGIIGTWRRVNPLFATTEFDRDLVQLVFRGLVELGPDGSIEPGLANLPSISDDGKRITFFLQEDLKWSDGAPLTSGDIAFTIGLLQAPDFRGDGDLAQAWSGVLVETPDPETVIVTLEQSHAPFVARFATLGILPRHLLANASAMEAMDDPFNSRPIGAGPFAVKRLDSDRVHLVPNP
ncbi:MAG TPA: ABC transporter substrate-binding protein, partial [Dehalococcoidia bacterium]|nr:ABC transporter substrate-binding protein [Dehalococcoidia bacterium]